jgi:hypothetical protein
MLASPAKGCREANAAAGFPARDAADQTLPRILRQFLLDVVIDVRALGDAAVKAVGPVPPWAADPEPLARVDVEIVGFEAPAAQALEGASRIGQ